ASPTVAQCLHLTPSQPNPAREAVKELVVEPRAPVVRDQLLRHATKCRDGPVEPEPSLLMKLEVPDAVDLGDRVTVVQRPAAVIVRVGERARPVAERAGLLDGGGRGATDRTARRH